LVPGSDLRDARTGQIISATAIVPSGDEGPGRGVALDIDPNFAGYEFWGADSNIYGAQVDGQGNVTYAPIYARPSNMHQNFGVWWDADLLRETLDGTTIGDWNYTTRGRVNLVSSGGSGINNSSGLSSNNGTKSTPTLSGDIMGDWREEVIWRTSDNSALQIWSTSIVATNRLYTLMHDPVYRMAITWQNAAYNQPPHPGYFLGGGMAAPPKPKTYLTSQLAGDYNRDEQVDASDYVLWRKSLGSMTNLQADGNRDGIVNSSDHSVWSANFAEVSSAGAGAASIDIQTIDDSFSNDAVLWSASYEAVVTVDLRGRVQVPPIGRRSAVLPAVENVGDLRLISVSRSETGRQESLLFTCPLSVEQIDESQETRQQSEWDADFQGEALSRMSKRDFTSFTSDLW
jgi:hypothetical protein